MPRKKDHVPPGFTTDEFGELRRKPTKGAARPPWYEDLLDAVTAKATAEIQAVEDQRVFDVLDQAALTPDQQVLLAQFKVTLSKALEALQVALSRAVTDLLIASQPAKAPSKSRKGRPAKKSRKGRPAKKSRKRRLKR